MKLLYEIQMTNKIGPQSQPIQFIFIQFSENNIIFQEEKITFNHLILVSVDNLIMFELK